MMKTIRLHGFGVAVASINRRSILTGLATLASLAGPGTVANAQAVSSVPAAARPSWFGAVGFDPFDFDLRTRDPGVQGQGFGVLGRSWNREESKLGFRAQLMLGADLPRGIAVRREACGGCEVGYRRSFGALAALATYSWRHSNAAIQPYVVGGPSVHYAKTDFVVKGVLTYEAASEVPLPTPATLWSAGVSAGAGLNLRFGQRSFFIEQSILLPAIIGRSSTSGEQVSSPLSIGVRF